MRTTGAPSILIAVLALTATIIPRSARANLIVFQDRTTFAQALDNRSLLKTVEGWDTYPAGTIFTDGSTVNGITYNVSSSGDALVVSTGVSLSPLNTLFVTNCPEVQTCSFNPLVDTFTFRFPQPIRAFGITFSSTFAISNGDYLLTTDRGDVIPSFFDPLTPGFPLGQFAGFVADEPFDSVTVSSTANALYGMDDLVFARSVPEPSSLVLLSFGLFGLGAGTRRLRMRRRPQAGRRGECLGPYSGGSVLAKSSSSRNSRDRKSGSAPGKMR